MVLYFEHSKNGRLETIFQYASEDKDSVIEVKIPGHVPREDFAVLEKYLIKAHPRTWIN